MIVETRMIIPKHLLGIKGVILVEGAWSSQTGRNISVTRSQEPYMLFLTYFTAMEVSSSSTYMTQFTSRPTEH